MDYEKRMQALEHRIAAVESVQDDVRGQYVRIEGKVDAAVSDARAARMALRRVELDTLRGRHVLGAIADKVGVERRMRASELQEDEEEETLQRVRRLERSVRLEKRGREPRALRWGRFVGYALGAIVALGVAFREVKGAVTELLHELHGSEERR